MMVIHQRTHPLLNVEGCYGCKISGVTFTGMVRLAQERHSNQTQYEMKQEIYKDAREDGRDIRRAGSVSPTSGGLL